MRQKQKVNSGFTRFSDERLVVLTQTVLEAMERNSNFINPEPDLEKVGYALESYVEKLAKARRRGSPYDTAIKNEARVELERILAELAFYVNKVSQNNLPVLLSSGFEVSRYRNSVLLPDIVRNLLLVDGNKKGQMRLSFEKQESARLYEYRYTKEKDAEGAPIWNKESEVTTSSMNNLIDSVVSGSVYYISVRAINTKGTGEWSEPVSWMVR